MLGPFIQRANEELGGEGEEEVEMDARGTKPVTDRSWPDQYYYTCIHTYIYTYPFLYGAYVNN